MQTDARLDAGWCPIGCRLMPDWMQADAGRASYETFHFLIFFVLKFIFVYKQQHIPCICTWYLSRHAILTGRVKLWKYAQTLSGADASEACVIHVWYLKHASFTCDIWSMRHSRVISEACVIHVRYLKHASFRLWYLKHASFTCDIWSMRHSDCDIWSMRHLRAIYR